MCVWIYIYCDFRYNLLCSVLLEFVLSAIFFAYSRGVFSKTCLVALDVYFLIRWVSILYSFLLLAASSRALAFGFGAFATA